MRETQNQRTVGDSAVADNDIQSQREKERKKKERMKLEYTFSWNFFWKRGPKSVHICPRALQAAYRTLGCCNIKRTLFLKLSFQIQSGYGHFKYAYFGLRDVKVTKNAINLITKGTL